MCSAVVVLAFIGCVFATDIAGGDTNATVDINDVWKYVKEGASEKDALAQAGMNIEEKPPEWFLLETDAPPLIADFANSNYTLISAHAQGALEDVKPKVAESLEDKGWLYVDSAHENLATFIKQEGRCSWLMIEYMQNGRQTNAVLHILHD